MISAEQHVGGSRASEFTESAYHVRDGLPNEQLSRILFHATQAVSHERYSPERLLNSVVRELAPAPDTASAVLMVTRDNELTVPYAHASNPEIANALTSKLTDREARVCADHDLQRVLETRTSLFIRHVKRVEPVGYWGHGECDPASSVEVTSLLVVPLTLQGGAIGAIALGRVGTEASPLDERDLHLVQSIAEHFGLAFAATRLFQTSERELAEREKMAARLRLMSDVSLEFAEMTGDYQRLLESIARRLSSMLGDLCSVRAVSENGKMLERGAVHHADPEIVAMVEALIGQPQRVDEGVAGQVIASGQPLFSPNLTREDWGRTLPHYRVILERLNVGSTMLVPLRCGGEAMGVVSLARSGFDNPYTEDDLRLVQSIAARAAFAISNARSYLAERAARAALAQANEALRESETAHRLLFESSPMAVLAFSVDSLEILAANKAALHLYGYTQEEMLGMKVSDLRENPDPNEVRTIIADVGDAEVAGSARHVRKNGSLFYAEYDSHILVLNGRRARITVVNDVTSRHEAEQMRALLSAIVCSSNDAIVSTDLHGIITSWNRAAECLFGHSSAAAVGKPSGMLIPVNLREEETTLLATVAAGMAVSNHETARRRSDGALVHVSLSLSPILDAAGIVVGISTTARDLTAQLAAAAALRRTEEQLRQAQKMEAIGQLAGGIAHDFNNVLSVILAHSDLILYDLAANHPMGESVHEIQVAATRAAALTRQLLTFSRKQVVAPCVLDLNDALSAMDKMLRRVIGEDIELRCIPAANLGRVVADRSNLDQVIMNLVVNARDAMPKGGKLTLETANVALDAEYTQNHLGSKPGQYVMLAVSDNGVGMEASTKERIFEPFFTTKPRDKGTGLGLSTVFGIVQQAGGCIEVYSERGKGTVFKVYLPRVQTELAPISLAPGERVRRGTETILLVEDQESVRAVALRILKRSGYHVVVATSVADAVELCEQHDGSIDLLLTDVVMPHMSGTELARTMVEMHPQTKVLYMSGYTDDSVVRHGLLESTMPFLQKPFTAESLSAKVRAVLDGRDSWMSEK